MSTRHLMAGASGRIWMRMGENYAEFAALRTLRVAQGRWLVAPVFGVRRLQRRFCDGGIYRACCLNTGPADSHVRRRSSAKLSVGTLRKWLSATPFVRGSTPYRCALRLEAGQPPIAVRRLKWYINAPLKIPDSLALAWFAAFSVVAFLGFGFDKGRASRSGHRVPESVLVLLGALGGWPGGVLAMKIFRHKTIKRTFQFKYACALVPFVAEVWAWLHWR